MMSTVSLDKRCCPFWRMMVFTLKKNLSVIIMGCVVSLLAMPIFPLTSAFREEYYSADAIDVSITVGLVLVLMIAFLMVAVLSVINFGFLHNKSGSDMFYSLPITRKTLYLSRLAATFIGASIPAVISLTLSWILPFLFSSYFKAPISSFIIYTLFCVLAVAIISIIVSMFMLFTGHTFDAVIAFVGLNLGIPIIIPIVSAYADSCLFGYYDNSLDFFDFLEFSPIGSLVNVMRELIFNFNQSIDYKGYISVGIIIWSVISLGILLLCIKFSQKRRSEKAGEAYAHALLPVILQLLIGVLAAFGLGEIFSFFTSFTLVYFIFAIVGALLATVLLGAIIRRGFKGIKRDIILGCCSSALVIAFGVSLMTGFFGYETRVPNVDNIEMAILNYESGYAELSDTCFTTKEDLQKVTRLHKTIIDKTGPVYYSLFTGKRYHNEFDEDYGTSKNYVNFEITYTLKNGSVLEREYYFYDSAAEEEIKAVLNSENYMNCFTVTELHKGLHSSELYYYADDGDYYSVDGVSLTLDDANRIVEAYRKDIVSGVEGTIAFYLRASEIRILNTGEMTRSYIDEDAEMNLALNSTFTNTIAVMEDLGFALDNVLSSIPPEIAKPVS